MSSELRCTSLTTFFAFFSNPAPQIFPDGFDGEGMVPVFFICLFFSFVRCLDQVKPGWWPGLAASAFEPLVFVEGKWDTTPTTKPPGSKPPKSGMLTKRRTKGTPPMKKGFGFETDSQCKTTCPTCPRIQLWFRWTASIPRTSWDSPVQTAVPKRRRVGVGMPVAGQRKPFSEKAVMLARNPLFPGWRKKECSVSRQSITVFPSIIKPTMPISPQEPTAFPTKCGLRQALRRPAALSTVPTLAQDYFSLRESTFSIRN